MHCSGCLRPASHYQESEEEEMRASLPATARSLFSREKGDTDSLHASHAHRNTLRGQPAFCRPAYADDSSSAEERSRGGRAFREPFITTPASRRLPPHHQPPHSLTNRERRERAKAQTSQPDFLLAAFLIREEEGRVFRDTI